MRRWRRPERFYDLLAPLARLLVGLLADLRVVGAERIPARGGILLAANHASFLDPVVLAVALYDCGRKVRFLALADLFDNPLVGWLLRDTPAGTGRRAWPTTPARPWMLGRRCSSTPKARSCRPARPARPGPAPACLPCAPACRCCRSPPAAWSATGAATCRGSAVG
jgi:1-acyl-sn-glycerol-3-phosphate acyltransferase